MTGGKTIKARLVRLEEQAHIQQGEPEWTVHIDTIGMPQDEADKLRAEAERLAMPPGRGPVRIVEVSCPTWPVEDDWAERQPRLEIWGEHPDATRHTA